MRHAQQRYPEDFWINYDLGHLFLLRPPPLTPEEAVGYFRAAVAIRPRSAEAHSILGLALVGKHDVAGGIAAYQHAIALDPRFEAPHLLLGDVWRSQEKFKEAMHEYSLAATYYSRAIDRNPKVHTNWLHRGHCYLNLAKWDEAAADFTKLVDQWPDDPEGWYLRCVAYAQLSRREQALADLRQAIAKGFKDVERINNEPRLNPLRGNDDSKKQFDLMVKQILIAKAATIAARFRDWPRAEAAARHDLGVVFLQMGTLAEAEEQFRMALSLQRKVLPADEPATLKTQNRLAMLLVERGKWEEATSLSETIIRLEPNNPRWHNNLAWLLATHADLKVRDPRRAVKLGMKAVELVPQDGNNWNTLGTAHYYAGEWQAACDALKKSMKLSNGGTDFDWFILAMAQWQLGHKDEARQLYNQAVQWGNANQPSNGKRRRFRAEAAKLLGIHD